MNYYIADTHFGHENILRHNANNGARHFSSIEEYNNLLITNWNNVITPSDNVYILGDFSWLYAQDTLKILKELKGAKFLVKGNHCRFAKDGACKKEFQGIYDYKQIEDNGRVVILSHYPIMMWNGQHRGAIHLFGHVHNSIENDLYQDYLKNLNDYYKNKRENFNARAYNVGCMMPHMNYTPRTLDEIIKTSI